MNQSSDKGASAVQTRGHLRFRHRGAVPDPTIDSPRGRGIMLVDHFADGLSYGSKGNYVEIGIFFGSQDEE